MPPGTRPGQGRFQAFGAAVFASVAGLTRSVRTDARFARRRRRPRLWQTVRSASAFHCVALARCLRASCRAFGKFEWRASGERLGFRNVHDRRDDSDRDGRQHDGLFDTDQLQLHDIQRSGKRGIYNGWNEHREPTRDLRASPGQDQRIRNDRRRPPARRARLCRVRDQRGGKCRWSYAIVLVETPTVIEEHLSDEVSYAELAPVVEVFIQADFGEPLAAGAHIATAWVWLGQDGFPQSHEGEAMVTIIEQTQEEPGAVISGSVEVTLDDPAVQLSGTFTAPVCSPLGSGPCGA